MEADNQLAMHIIAPPMVAPLTITREDIMAMFEGIDDATREVVVRGLKAQFSAAIAAVNRLTQGMPRTVLCPPQRLTMAAFRECPLARARIIIFGQDPYATAGCAHGLSFSVPRGVKLPPSLRNIFNCLHHYGLIAQIPPHGDLTKWARQGVLLLNCSLTTVLGVANAHEGAWEEYTSALIKTLAARAEPLIFILLGTFAHSKEKLLAAHSVLKWGHPSPMNAANKSDNPKNFKYCDVFTRANDILTERGDAAVCWDTNDGPGDDIMAGPVVEPVPAPMLAPVTGPIAVDLLCEVGPDDPVPPIDAIWIFTDGGSEANGRAACRASWGFYITDGTLCARPCGIVPGAIIPGQVFQASNNRGELYAVLAGLEYVQRNVAALMGTTIYIISDSEYSIGAINCWVDGWIADPTKQCGKKNLDLILGARAILSSLERTHAVQFGHMRSHRREPADPESPHWFTWAGNDKADRLCNRALGRPDPKPMLTGPESLAPTMYARGEAPNIKK